MALEIKWLPDVCSCEILQDRHEPDIHFEFIRKCELHENLDDTASRAEIILLCAQNQEQ